VQRVEGFHSPTQPAQHTSPSLDELHKVYDHRLHIPARFLEPTWSSWFRINSRMVAVEGGSAIMRRRHLLARRCQGMNTGIQDMINLPWKLVMVWAGKAHGSGPHGPGGPGLERLRWCSGDPSP
jgi:hypothetical protein